MDESGPNEKKPQSLALRNGKQRRVLVPISKNRVRNAQMDTANSSVCIDSSILYDKGDDQPVMGNKSSFCNNYSAIKDRFEVLMDDTACDDQSMRTEINPFSELDVPSKKRKMNDEACNDGMKMAIDSSAVLLKEEEKMEPSEDNSKYLTAKTELKHTIEDANALYTTSGFGMEIYEYQISREQKRVGRPRLNYMDKQKELKCTMRTTLIDWFSDVCREYQLCSATFFLATSLVDRTLSFVDCPRAKLQLVGATSIFVAAKMEEVYPPTLQDIVFVTESSYTEAQVLRMEQIILRMVDFELSIPMVDTFASFFSFFRPIAAKTNCLMWYLLELSLLDYECLRFKPSCLAAGAYVLAVLVTSDAKKAVKEDVCGGNRMPDSMSFASALSTPFSDAKAVFSKQITPSSVDKFWTSELMAKTGIPSNQIAAPVKELARLHRSAAQDGNKSIFLKYAGSSNYQVSSTFQMPESL